MTTYPATIATVTICTLAAINAQLCNLIAGITGWGR